MTSLRLKSQVIAPAAIRLIAGALKGGQVLVLPTDTIYGLSCRADDARAVRRVYRLKGRSEKKPFITLVSSLAMLKRYALVSQRQARELSKIWRPNGRPTTVILALRRAARRTLPRQSSTLAVRLPKSKFLIKIIKTIKVPIISTSLNLSGQKAVFDPRQLDHYFPDPKNQPDLLVDAGRCRRQRPSRIIDLRSGGEPLILRK
ncbi:MAG: L-threonylcarbamoyladenylate synthase [Patescibacteria group bacterium]